MASTSEDVRVDVSTGYNSSSHRRTHSGVDAITINNSNSSQSHRRSSNTPKPTIRDMIRFYRRRLLKLAILATLCLAVAVVYVEYFKHPPADVVLVMNRGSQNGQKRFNDFGASAFKNSNEEEEEEEEECEEEDKKECEEQKKEDREMQFTDPSDVEGAEDWGKFLKRNNMVPIGAVYDRCENWRKQYGTVVLLKDNKYGGLKTRTYINITLDEEIATGQFNIAVKYNGQDLYDNYWNLCETEEELPKENRTFLCPVAAGKHSKMRDRHVPIYLPTGRYQIKGWSTDESERLIACGYADFML